MRLLITEIDPDAEADVFAGYLLGAISASVLARLLSEGVADKTTLQRAVIQLVRGVTHHC